MNNEFARPYAYKRFPEQLGQHLGGGLFFSVFDKPGDPDTVVKVARRGRWSLSDLKGQRVYQRMAHDLFLVKRYLGEYLLPTNLIEKDDHWFFEQRKMHNFAWASNRNADRSLSEKILHFVTQTNIMFEETGFAFDFTGSDLVYELLRFNFTGWSLPSLLVEDGRLKFAYR